MSKRRKIPDALTGVHLRTSTLPDAGVSGIENHRSVQHDEQLRVTNHSLYRRLTDQFLNLYCSVSLYSISPHAHEELGWNLLHLYRSHLDTSTHLRRMIMLLENVFITSK